MIAFEISLLSISKYIPLELSIPFYSEIQFRLKTIPRTAKICIGSLQTIPRTAKICTQPSGAAEWFERFQYSLGLNASNADFGGPRNGLKASNASNIAFGCPRNGLNASNTGFGCLRNGLNASSTDFGCPRNGLKAELYFGIDRNGELQRNMF